MNFEDAPLMNFRIPITLKTQFNEICKSKRTAMTSEMIRMITGYVRTAIKEDLEFANLKNREDRKEVTKKEDRVERWGSLIKDPITQTWVSEEEYRNHARI